MRPPDKTRREAPISNRRLSRTSSKAANPELDRKASLPHAKFQPRARSIDGETPGPILNCHWPADGPDGWRHVGMVTDKVLTEVGRCAIAYNLSRGYYADADAIRASLGLSWAEVIGVESADRAA